MADTLGLRIQSKVQGLPPRHTMGHGYQSPTEVLISIRLLEFKLVAWLHVIIGKTYQNWLLLLCKSPVHVFNSLLVFQRIHALFITLNSCIDSSPGSFSCNQSRKPSAISFLLTTSELGPLVCPGLHSAAVCTSSAVPIIVAKL